MNKAYTHDQLWNSWSLDHLLIMIMFKYNYFYRNGTDMLSDKYYP